MKNSLVWKNVGLGLLLAAAVGGAGCGGSDDEQSSPSTNACEKVADACKTEGERKCADTGGSLLICKKNADKCNVWSTERSCGDRASCVDAACVCNDECSAAGVKRCTGEVVEACSPDSVGCLGWMQVTDCTSTAQTCEQAGDQAACVGTCVSDCPTEGELRCEGDLLQSCDADSEGCRHWMTSTDCAATMPAQTCDDTGAAPQCVSTCTDTCPSDGAMRCEGDAVQTCATGTDGCLAWGTTTDCAANTPAQTCDASSGTPACADTCTDGCPSENDVQCEGDLIETCTAGSNGCLAWETTTDCATNTPAQTCDDAGGAPACVNSCTDSCPNENDLQCSGDLIQTCTTGSNGCLAWETTTDCAGLTPAQTCNASGGAPVCANTCTDGCPNENDVQCSGDLIQTCTTGSNGCLAWETTTDCAALTPAQTCEDTGGSPICVGPEVGESCTNPQLIAALPFQVADTDFPNNFTDDHNFTGNTNCSAGSGAEAIFQIALTEGQTIRLRETTSFDAVIRVLDVCEATAACLVSQDYNENFTFTAPATGDYFIVLESYSATPTNVIWEFLVEEVLPETACANGTDDDGDGDTDCQDSDCFGVVGACETEVDCEDGLDNDADGSSDCADSDCATLPVCDVPRGVFEQFSDLNPSDFEGCTLLYSPNAAGENGYDEMGACDCAPAWAHTPGTGTVTSTLSLGDDAAVEHALTAMGGFTFFGNSYTSLFVGSNGFVTFAAEDTSASSSTATFFGNVRVAGIDTDLNPASGANGTITVDEWADRVVVTFDGVNYYNQTSTVSFQIVMESDGDVMVVYLGVGIKDRGFAGVSNGVSSGTLPTATDLLEAVTPKTAGQLLISEIHYNDANASSEGAGEFIEVYNPTSSALDLGCCVLQDNNGTFDIPDQTLIDANGYGVFVRNGDAAANGGISGGVEYGNTIQLANTNPENITVTCGSTVIDAVPFDTESVWPGGADGASMQLSSIAMDAGTNDSTSVWCSSTDAYGTGDLGTPGGANTDCAPTSFLSADFEADPSWSTVGDWAWGAPSASYTAGPSACAEGVGCYGTNLAGAYSASTEYATNHVQAPTMDLSAATFVSMSFDMWLNSETGYDLAVVEISTDGGTSWAALGVTSPAYNGPTSNADSWTGDFGSAWLPASADLSAFAGQADVQVRWALESDSGINRAGFYIDNVTVVGL